MRAPITWGKTVFSMARGTGEWAAHWVITNEKTGRPHLILDTEREADAAMDGIQADAEAYESMINEA